MILIGNSNFSWSKQVMYLLFRYFNFSALVLFYHFLSCSALSFCNLILLCSVPSSFVSPDLDVFFSDLVREPHDESFFFICHYFFSFLSSHGLVVSILFSVLFFSFYVRMRCYAFIDDLIACLARWGWWLLMAWWLDWMLGSLMVITLIAWWIDELAEWIHWLTRTQPSTGDDRRSKCSFNAVNFLKMLVFNLGAMSHDQWRTVFNGSSWCSILNHVSVVVRQ